MAVSPRMLRAVFFAFAVLFVLLLPWYPYPGGLVIKAIPALSLAVLALTRAPGQLRRWLFLALLLSAVGDAVLGLHDRYGGPYFILGLGLFLLAHLAYAAAFLSGFRLRRSRVPIAGLLVAYCVILALLLSPGLGEITLPVYVYILVITAMALLAALRKMPDNRLLYGALAFVLSDSLIAVNKFLRPVPAAPYLTIITYYFALYLIAQAFVEGHQR